MKKAYVLLATGFEEMEAIGTIDILRRGGIETVTLSVTGDKTVTGVHGISVIADDLIENIEYWVCDALVLPGGGPGSLMLNESRLVRQAVRRVFNDFNLIAAICAAPRVFGSMGLLDSRKATCYPGIEPELIYANVVTDPVVVDDNVMTARGPGFVIDFGLAILTYLKADADQVARDLLIAK